METSQYGNFSYSTQNSLDRGFTHRLINYWLEWLSFPVSIINVIGVLANIFLFSLLVTLRRRQEISDAGLILLCNEAIVDFQNSLYAIIYTHSDFHILPDFHGDFEWIREFVCLVWHSQYPYWVTYCVSVFNEVLLSTERYIAISFPFHQDKFRKRIPFFLFLLYLTQLTFNSPYFFYNEYNFTINDCIASHFHDDLIFFRWYSIVWSLEAYLFPAIANLFINGLIIKKLRITDKILSIHSTQSSNFKNKASRMLLKASITISVLYVFTMFYTNYFYVTQSHEGIYDSYDIRNIIGIGLATFHFSFKPLIVMFFLPAIRRFTFDLLTARRRRQ